MTLEPVLRGICTGKKYAVLGTPGGERIGLPVTLLRADKAELMLAASHCLSE